MFPSKLLAFVLASGLLSAKEVSYAYEWDFGKSPDLNELNEWNAPRNIIADDATQEDFKVSFPMKTTQEDNKVSFPMKTSGSEFYVIPYLKTGMSFMLSKKYFHNLDPTVGAGVRLLSHQGECSIGYDLNFTTLINPMYQYQTTSAEGSILIIPDILKGLYAGVGYKRGLVDYKNHYYSFREPYQSFPLSVGWQYLKNNNYSFIETQVTRDRWANVSGGIGFSF